MRTETATKKITQSGDSLVINVTKEAHRLGLVRVKVSGILSKMLFMHLDIKSRSSETA